MEEKKEFKDSDFIIAEPVKIKKRNNKKKGIVEIVVGVVGLIAAVKIMK